MSEPHASTDFFARVRWVGYACALAFMGLAGFGRNFAADNTKHELTVATELVRSLNGIEAQAGRLSLNVHSGPEDGPDAELYRQEQRSQLETLFADARGQVDRLSPDGRLQLQDALQQRDFLTPLRETVEPLMPDETGTHAHAAEARFASEHYFVETLLPAIRKTVEAVDSLRLRNLDMLKFQGLVSFGLLGFIIAAVACCIFVPMELAITRTMRELRAAMQKAEAAHQAKSDFLANMSHEIRTPMNGVMGMAKLLERSELNDKQRTFTDIIVKSGNALLTIINDVLDFSKIEAGEVTLDPEPFRLFEAVEDVATLISAMAGEKGLEVIVRIQPDLPQIVVGDAGRIRQVLTNLVGNGVKFTEAGHVLIDVSGTVSDGTAELLVKVVDTGIGIPEDAVGTVFEKFSQVDASSTRRHEGTGLGLTISQRLVGLMGGEMGAESELGVGSTFWFSVALPVEREAEPAAGAPDDLRGARVLVVDDNETGGQVLAEKIGAWEFAADTAKSGDSALNMLIAAAGEDRPYEMVLLDRDLTDMQSDSSDGMDVALRIRADRQIGSTALVIMVSVDRPAEGASRKTGGICEQIVKSARSADLLRIITDTLHKARSAGGKEQSNDNEVGGQKGLRAARRGGSGKVIQVAVAGSASQRPVEQALEHTDHTYFIVDNGLIAAALVRELRPSLVIAEFPGPGGAATDLVQAVNLAGVETGCRIPVLALNNPANPVDQDTLDQAGIDRVLDLPISADRLAALIESLVAESDEGQRMALRA